MKRAVAARVASAVALAVVSVTVLAGSQAVAVGQERLAVAVSRQLQLAATGTVPAPSADSFRSVRSYPQVAEPVRLRIPAAGVDTSLLHLRRAGDGSVEVPADFGVAGWFAEGPRPGQPGPSVILGHVDSRTGPAVFFRVGTLARGAEVLVDRADGSTVAFRVRGTQHVAKVAFPTEQVYGPTLEPSLRLVTCGGSFDRTTESYRDNVIVYADPAD